MTDTPETRRLPVRTEELTPRGRSSIDLELVIFRSVMTVDGDIRALAYGKQVQMVGEGGSNERRESDYE